MTAACSRRSSTRRGRTRRSSRSRPGRPAGALRHRLRGRAVGVDAPAVLAGGLALLRARHRPPPARAQARLAQAAQDEGLLAAEVDGLGRARGQELGRVPLLELLQEPAGGAELAQLALDAALPDRLDRGVRLREQAAVVGPGLPGLVQDPALEPGLPRVQERLIESEVLLLQAR